MARSIRIHFAMEWDTYPDKAKQLKAIADAAKNADALILATDPDREGRSAGTSGSAEKAKVLPASVERVTFNAITKSAGDGSHGASARAR